MYARCLIAIVTVFAAVTAGAREEDHLAPADGYLSSYGHSHVYLTAVRDILVRSSVDSLAVMVTLPSFQAESMVYLRPKGDAFEVISARCSEQIWSSEKRDAIKIQQSERAISKKAADLITSVFSIATSRSRYATEPTLGLDGVTYHFSSFLRGTGVRAGQTWSPDPASACGQLVKLGEDLARYVRGDASEEDLIAEATSLAHRLKKNA
jgi:hypothetical protein